MKTITNTTQIGKIIYLFRKNQGLTQAQLASTCGVGIRFIRELEKGKRSCHLGKVLTVINMLGIEMLLNGPASDAFSGAGKGSDDDAGSGDGPTL